MNQNSTPGKYSLLKHLRKVKRIFAG